MQSSNRRKGGKNIRSKIPDRNRKNNFRISERNKSSGKKKVVKKNYYDEKRERELLGVEERRKLRAERIKKMNERREKRQKFTQGKYLIYVVFAFIIIYFAGYGISFSLREDIAFDTIQIGSVDEPKSVKGIIIRDETVYKSSASGAIVYNVSDNEKVRNGSVVCSIRDEEAVKNLELNLNDINKSIMTMQENRDDLSLFYEDVKKVNSQIKGVVDEEIYNFSTFNIGIINDFKSSVQKKIDTRNQMLLSENRGSLTELAEKKKNQEELIAKNVLTMSAKNGGIVSYYTDGLEETINVSNIDKLTKEQTTMDTESFDIKTYVSSGDKVFKIVNSNDWYIAAYIPNSYIEGWKPNDWVTVYSENDKTDGKISANIYKLESGESESYVVLKITKDMLDYIDKRSINFEISKSDVGFKIPLSAVVQKTILKVPKEYVDENENSVIRVLDGGTKENIIIENSGSDSEGKFVYTLQNDGGLKLGDKLQNPESLEDIYEVKEVINIQGVYIINSGIAEFKTLNTEGSSENSTHMIVMPENNSKIRLYDRVLTDTSNVEEEEKVYE